MPSEADMPPEMGQVESTERCFECFRPRQLCFCDHIPTVENKTDLLILQHARERFHPFNTARIVHKALTSSELLIAHTPEFTKMQLPLNPKVGLLFPSDSALLLEELSPAERPEQVVVIDGTWHHAKTIFRDVPVLQQLTQYRLAPVKPGNYRIRREPTETALSTLEAVVAMLRILEPETSNLDSLLSAFNKMVDDQLAHPNCRDEWRRRKARNRPFQKIPRALTSSPSNVVVAYAETTPRLTNETKGAKRPVYWLAQRLSSGESFRSAIRPDIQLEPSICDHYELPETFFNDAIAPADFARKWESFLRPDDVLVVYYKGTLQLLKNIGVKTGASVILKTVCRNLGLRGYSIEDLCNSNNILTPTALHPGRAGRRLALAIALVQQLPKLAEMPAAD
ncbi:MAG: DTW domain-containing protein YfiP [Pirellulaceae bacterium]|jgi:DTW domain-containing protein YfiP